MFAYCGNCPVNFLDKSGYMMVGVIQAGIDGVNDGGPSAIININAVNECGSGMNISSRSNKQDSYSRVSKDFVDVLDIASLYGGILLGTYSIGGRIFKYSVSFGVDIISYVLSVWGFGRALNWW